MNTAAVAKLCGVSLRQLQWWDEQGLVVPGRVQRSAGSGSARVYSADDVRRVRVVGTLLRKGFTLRQVRVVLKQALKHNCDFTCAIFATDGRRVLETESVVDAYTFAASTETRRVAIVQF